MSMPKKMTQKKKRAETYNLDSVGMIDEDSIGGNRRYVEKGASKKIGYLTELIGDWFAALIELIDMNTNNNQEIDDSVNC